jgi:hypothetical protein
VPKLAAEVWGREDPADLQARAWTHASFSPDGSLLALSSPHAATLVVDAFTLELVGSISEPGVPGLSAPDALFSAAHAFTPDGGLLLVGVGGGPGVVCAVDLTAISKAAGASAASSASSAAAAAKPLPPPVALDGSGIAGASKAACTHDAPLTFLAHSPVSTVFLSAAKHHAALWSYSGTL